jgi:hypothetical protein
MSLAGTDGITSTDYGRIPSSGSNEDYDSDDEDAVTRSLKELCDNLKITYDSNLIEETRSKPFIERFKKYIIYCTRSPQSYRPVLSRLIHNYYNKKRGLISAPTPRFIGGPKNLTVHWSSKYNKLIYIFGEFHQQTMNCYTKFPETRALVYPNIMNIQDFVIELFKTTDKYIDFFGEFPSFGKKNRFYMVDRNAPFIPFASDDFRLNKLFQKFRKCIESDTRGSYNCQLGRVHFFDVRCCNDVTTDCISTLMRWFVSGAHDTKNIPAILTNQQTEKTLEVFSGYLKTTTKAITLFRAHILGNTYNATELQRLKNKDKKLGDQLEKFITAEITRIVNVTLVELNQDIKNILPYCKILKNPTNPLSVFQTRNMIQSFMTFANHMVTIVAIIPDLYVLSRMFKNFDLEKLAYAGAIQNDQPREAHNIVLYAGDTHAQRCRRFLNLLEFEEVGKTGKSEEDNVSDSCIDMKYIHQPFFSLESRQKMIIPPVDDYDFDYDHIYALQGDPMKVDPVFMETD